MRYLIFTSLLWAFSFSLIKTYLTGLPSYLVASIRLFLSLILFSPFFNIKIFKKKKQFLSLFVLGAVQYGIMYLAYIHSYKYLKAYEVAVFTIFTPIFVVYFGEMFQKKFTFRNFIAPFLAVVGAGIIVFQKIGTQDFWYGFLLIQLANISFAFGQNFYKKIKNTYKENDSSLFFPIYLGAFVLTTVPVVLSQNLVPTVLTVSVTQWVVIFYLGIIPSGLGFFMWNKGASLVSVKTLSVMNNIKIPLAIIVSIFLFKEKANIIRLVIGVVFMLYALKISYKKEKVYVFRKD